MKSHLSDSIITMIRPSSDKIAIKCLICEDTVSLTGHESIRLDHGLPVFKVCDRCKEAVMRMRSQLDDCK